MKKLIIYILFITGVLTISCDDEMLQVTPLDDFSDELIFDNYTLTKYFLYDAYMGILPRLFNNPRETRTFWGAEIDDLTDNVVINEGVTYTQDLLDVTFNAGWGNAWRDIRKCNMVIKRVAESEKMTDNEKSELISEGKMLRAITYWTKARVFGRFIIIDSVLTPDDEMIRPQCKDIKTMYDFIIKDMQEAAPYLRENGEDESTLTKGAAYAFLAEVAVHGAAYLEDATDKQAYYKIAEEAGDSLFAMGEYEIDPSYGDMFNSYETGRASKEVMLTFLKSKQNTEFWYTPMLYLVANSSNKKNGYAEPLFTEIIEGWAGRYPSIEFVADYYIIEDGEAKNWNETDAYQDVMDGNAYVSKLYQNRDNRFYASISYDSSKYFGNWITTRLDGNLDPRRSNNGTSLQTKTSYFVRKGIYFDNFLYADFPTDYHYVLMRYGRATLNHAEALIRQGRHSEAVEYINMTRVGHGGLPALVYESDDQVLREFKRERRIELFMENDRYWSLLRWGKEENMGDNIPELNGEAQTFTISADGSSFVIEDLPYNHDANIKTFTSRRYLYPVPQSEYLKNPLLTQNPGWGQFN